MTKVKVSSGLTDLAGSMLLQPVLLLEVLLDAIVRQVLVRRRRRLVRPRRRVRPHSPRPVTAITDTINRAPNTSVPKYRRVSPNILIEARRFRGELLAHSPKRKYV